MVNNADWLLDLNYVEVLLRDDRRLSSRSIPYAVRARVL